MRYIPLFRGVGPVVMLIGLVLTGCAHLPTPSEREQRAEALARPAGLLREAVPTGSFTLTSFTRITRPDLPLSVYIEGDGFAFLSRSQPSADPTPLKAQALALAAADPAPNVIYLARPCQFTPQHLNPACKVAYWTSKRFAEEAVAAMNQAVSHFAKRVPGQPLTLIGFSGGGAMAALIAARRTDVISLRTVAGNLDTVEFNRLHKTTPMSGSLNAIDIAPRLRNLPQLHYYGAADTVVPGAIAQRFARATAGNCTQVRAVPGMSHNGDWAQLWPTLLAEPAHCLTSIEHAH